jgi:hypothetical protein
VDFIVKEGPLFKVCLRTRACAAAVARISCVPVAVQTVPGMMRSLKWELRWVVIMPTAVHVYKVGEEAKGVEQVPSSCER